MANPSAFAAVVEEKGADKAAAKEPEPELLTMTWDLNY